MKKQPPSFISSARVICYAFNDEHVEYINPVNLLVNGVKLGEMATLAICRELTDEKNFLLIFCDTNWENNGVVQVFSVDEAKKLAEKSYVGIKSNWIEVEVETESALASWPKNICAFCEKCSHEVLKVYSSENSAICNECIQLLNSFVEEDIHSN